MDGDFPPSSRVTFLTVPAASRMISRPTSVEPVKAILPTPGWDASRAPASGPGPGTTFSTPGGRPHSSAIRANSNVDNGVFSSGLTTTLLPAASAGAIFHSASSSGKFHGAIAPTTPMGSLRTVLCASVGKVALGAGRSKAYRSARSAKYSRCGAT